MLCRRHLLKRIIVSSARFSRVQKTRGRRIANFRLSVAQWRVICRKQPANSREKENFSLLTRIIICRGVHSSHTYDLSCVFPKNHKEPIAKSRPKKRRVHVPRTCLPVRVHNERQRRIHPPLPRPFRISQLPQDLRRAGRRGAPRGDPGRYVYCSKLSLLARVAAASHEVIFIIRPFVFSAAARPESNNSARRRPRERFSFSKSLSSPSPPLLSYAHPPSTFSDLRFSLLDCLSSSPRRLSLRHPRASLSLSSAVLMQHLSSSSFAFFVLFPARARARCCPLRTTPIFA